MIRSFSLPSWCHLAAAVARIGTLVHVILIALAVPSSARVQRSDLRFERISLEQGLSQSIVEGIVQDRTGFMWFITEDGLNRYDGYTFKVYKNDLDDPRSLSHNELKFIYEDRRGVVWIVTFEGGLNQYDRETETFLRFRHDPADPRSLSSDSVRAIYEDSSGVLWVGTQRSGLNKLDRETNEFSHFRHDPAGPRSLSHDDVRAVVEDSQGVLWVDQLARLLTVWGMAQSIRPRKRVLHPSPRGCK